MFKKFFIPANDSDITAMALAVLRVWLGLTMFFNHGLDKLTHFNDLVASFPDPLGIGQEASMMLVIFAEVAGSLLLAVGFLTRIAALTLVIDMFVAFLMVHKTALSGQGSGELAFLYLAGFVTILIAGGGTFSTDMVVFSRGKKTS
jgi:putative oxidoreductase